VDRLGVLGGADHTDFDRSHRHVFEHRARLRDHQIGWHGHELEDMAGVLYSDTGDHRRAVCTIAGDGFDIGLDAGTAGGVGTRETEHDGKGS